MAGNFNCSSCPLSASFYCICLPQKVYLCPQCIAPHCQKGGVVHSIVPISAQEAVSKLQDIEGYNQKRQVIQELSAVLDEMNATLTMERNQFAANFNQLYLEQANQLYAAYTKAGEEITALFQSIGDSLQSIKQEIQQWELGQIPALTEDTYRFVHIAAHATATNRIYVNLQEELSKRIKLTVTETESMVGSHFQRLADSWRLGSCTCKKCLVFEKAVGAKQMKQLRAGCAHFPNANTLVRCTVCRKVNPCYRCHDSTEDHNHVGSDNKICADCGKHWKSFLQVFHHLSISLNES